MKAIRKSHIVLAVLALFAAGVLFVTYGTVLPSLPFASIQLREPTIADSDGEFTVAVDTESHRALILNETDGLTGVVSCSTIDSPIDVIIDACVKDGLIYLAGVRYEPDSETIVTERVAAYDKGGNYQGVVYEIKGAGDVPRIKSLNDTRAGVSVAHDSFFDDGIQSPRYVIEFDIIEKKAVKKKVKEAEVHVSAIFDAAFAEDGDGGYHYATLSSRGELEGSESDYAVQVHIGHAFASIDIGEDGVLYACDDEKGALCAIAKDSQDVKVLADGTGFHGVHVNHGVISLCNSEANKVVLCDLSGAITSELTEVKPSIGYSARMLVVWASGLYLVVLALVLGVVMLRRQIKNGNTRNIGALFTSVAIAAAVAVAVGNFSFSAYQTRQNLRANEINMCADYLSVAAYDLSDSMERIHDRNSIRGSDEGFTEAAYDLIDAVYPALMLVESAKDNGIGLYCILYGKDDKGIYYLYGSSSEYVLGSTARKATEKGLQAAFEDADAVDDKILKGSTLRDATQYRLVPIPSSDGEGVAGVFEIGSKVHSFESAIAGGLVQSILALLVMVLVVYLAYSELRACSECLFSYRERRQKDGARAVAVLTRPFTVAITMLTSIDSVMTVLIARDLLTQAGMGDSSLLLAIPAVMLGLGMIIGQGLYAFAGSRVGLRRLMAIGAILMLTCALFTIVAVASGIFWLYCVAKLTMAVPFGMLYTMGYSLPRLARNDEDRALAAGGVRRTDTSAAALGTVLGGYAAQTLGNMWVYAIVAIACFPVLLMAINLLPKGMQPLEKLAQPDNRKGLIRTFAKTAPAFSIALFIVLPATLAAGYTSFLFPLFSSDHGLLKADVNNIFVLGQLVVYLCIDLIDRAEGRWGKWKVSTVAIALLGLVFLLFAVNTTLMWSIAVIVLVGVFGKSSDGWKAMWLKAAGESGIAAGRAVSAMFATRSLALIIQPFTLSALLGATDSIAVIVIGLVCAISAGLFFLITKRTSLVST